MPASVSDARSNKHEQVAHAAEVLQRAPNRLAVFGAIYHGKKVSKSRSELEAATGLDNKQVLNAAKILVDNQLVTQENVNGQTSYRKDPFFAAHKARILNLARDPQKMRNQPRSTHLLGNATTHLQVAVSTSLKPPKEITIDDIDSFAGVRAIREPQPKRVKVSESVVKEGVKRILGETAEFKDWGGEGNDLNTTRLKLGGKRCPTVFAFKGPAQTGKLTPGRWARTGIRFSACSMLRSTCTWCSTSARSGRTYVPQMAALALAKAAATNKLIRYCLIDGQDTSRLMEAYPEEFKYGG